MDKKTLISEDLKKSLMEDVQLCSFKDLEQIINDYNSDKELSKKDIFILGFQLSLSKKNTLIDLGEYGYSSDQLLVSNINDLISNLLKNI